MKRIFYYNKYLVKEKYLVVYFKMVDIKILNINLNLYEILLKK